MVEIAISLAIIGFALVAIIGILPIGMDAQKDNRQETIINQDAAYFMEAIRNGAQGLDDLTNYIEAITNVVTHYDANYVASPPVFYGYTYQDFTINGVRQPAPSNELINGHRIIGLLSTPKYIFDNPQNPVFSGVTSNYVFAYVRALSGAMSEKAPQDNSDVKDLAFRYRLVPEVIPYSGWDPNWVINDTNYWQVAKNMRGNLHDLRLLFRWPVFPSGQIGNGRQIFRTMASGYQTNQPPGSPWYFIESRAYAHVP